VAVLTAAVLIREGNSMPRDLDLFWNNPLSAMRFGFGGHVGTC
jgi:hypothetical protein